MNDELASFGLSTSSLPFTVLAIHVRTVVPFHLREQRGWAMRLR